MQKILMEFGLAGRAPGRLERPPPDAYEPWYKVGASLMPEARPSYVAYNLRTSEVITTMEGGLADIWNSKVAPATGADQINQAMQAILDQPR